MAWLSTVKWRRLCYYNDSFVNLWVIKPQPQTQSRSRSVLQPYNVGQRWQVFCVTWPLASDSSIETHPVETHPTALDPFRYSVDNYIFTRFISVFYYLAKLKPPQKIVENILLSLHMRFRVVYYIDACLPANVLGLYRRLGSVHLEEEEEENIEHNQH